MIEGKVEQQQKTTFVAIVWSVGPTAVAPLRRDDGFIVCLAIRSKLSSCPAVKNIETDGCWYIPSKLCGRNSWLNVADYFTDGYL